MKKKPWEMKKADKNNLINACKAAAKGQCSYFTNANWIPKPFKHGDYIAVLYDYSCNGARFHIKSILEYDFDSEKRKKIFHDIAEGMEFGYDGFFIFRKDWQEVSDLWEGGEDDTEKLPWKKIEG